MARRTSRPLAEDLPPDEWAGFLERVIAADVDPDDSERWRAFFARLRALMLADDAES